MYAKVKRKLDLWKPKLVFEIPNQNLQSKFGKKLEKNGIFLNKFMNFK